MLTRFVVLAALFGACLASGSVIWQAHAQYSVYDDIVMTHENTASTTDWLNPPYELATYEATGTGSPIWTWTGNSRPTGLEEIYAAGIRRPRSPVLVDLVGINYGGIDNATIQILGFEAKNKNPVWQFTVHSGIGDFIDNHLIDVAEDGSYFAMAYLDPATSVTNCLVLEAQTGKQYMQFSTPASLPHAPMRLDVSMTGRYVTFVDYNAVYQIDTSTKTLRGDVLYLNAIPASHAYSTNQDGDIFAFGFQTVSVYQWDNNNHRFVARWETEQSSYGVVEALHTGRGGLLFVGWMRMDSRAMMFERYEIANGSKPLWQYTTEESSGASQDNPDDIETDLNGRFIAVATWGDVDHLNPEVLVFSADKPEPIYTYDTPGSMFAIDVVESSTTSAIVCTAGKAVHANQFGNGGDAFCFRVSV